MFVGTFEATLHSFYTVRPTDYADERRDVPTDRVSTIRRLADVLAENVQYILAPRVSGR